MFPDNERDALDFMLYYLSTSLDAHKKESLFLIIHGAGSNGKSVLLELFRRTLGSCYVRKMPLSFITDLTRNRSSSADPATMELKNARLVYYSESDKNEKINVAKIKELTGGETISARGLYKDQENFEVKCNHIVMTNHLFVIETTEHAAWRRFLSYQMKHKFKFNSDPNNPFEREKNPELIAKITNDKRYHEAFLSILIHYRCKLYSQYGGHILKVPHDTIRKETEEYRCAQDIIQRYITENVYYYEGSTQLLDDVIKHFKTQYKADNGSEYKSSKTDMSHNFRNSSLQKYIIEKETGIFYLKDCYVRAENGANIEEGSILFTEWLKSKGE